MLGLLKSLLYVNMVTIAGFAIFYACANRRVVGQQGKILFVVMLYCNAIAFLSPNVIIHEIASFLVVPLFGRRQEHILPVYTFAFLTLPAISYSLAAGGTYLFVFTNFMSLSVGAYLTSIIKIRAYRWQWTAPAACLMAIVLVYFFAGARGGSITNMMRVLSELVFVMVLPYLIVKRSIRSANDAREMIIALVIASIILSVLACYEATKTWPIYRMIYDHYGIALGNEVQVKMRGGIMRATGPFIESTSFAVWLSFGTFAGLTGSWIFKSRAHHWIVCGVLLAGLFAPQSRGAWLGLIIAFVFFQIGKGRIGAMISGLVGATVFGAVGYGMARVIPQLGAMLGLNQSGTIMRDYRQDLFTRGIEEARKSLFFGADLDTVLDRLADMRQGEGIIDFVNTYLYVLLLSGIIGLIAFALGMFIPILVMWIKSAKYREIRNQPMPVIAALLGSLMVMLVFTSLSGRTTMGLGILLGAAAALASMTPYQIGRVSKAVSNRSTS